MPGPFGGVGSAALLVGLAFLAGCGTPAPPAVQAAGCDVPSSGVTTILAHMVFNGTDDSGGSPPDFSHVEGTLWRLESGGKQTALVRGAPLDARGCIQFSSLAPGRYLVGGGTSAGPFDGCSWYGDRSPLDTTAADRLQVRIEMRWGCV